MFPQLSMLKHYAQRATAGLIIGEGTAVSQHGQGYPNAPGIYTSEQIAGWRAVTQAVHARGGKIFLQIAHNGRNSHSSLMPDGGAPVAPPAIPSNLPGFTTDFRQVPIETPRALQLDEIRYIVEIFGPAARNAMSAGFDGVEIQASNSHLIDQFLRRRNKSANRRIDALSSRQLAYLHLIEGRGSEIGLTDQLHEHALNNAQLFRHAFRGPLISAAAYTENSAAQSVKDGHADAIAFGRSYIANPDLVERSMEDRDLNTYDRSTFYGGSEASYTDYSVR